MRRRAGGIEGAVAGSAQRAYDHLTPAQQAAARQVFLRLTATSSDGVDTAARATRAELTGGTGTAQAQDVEAVLEAFASERLITLAANTVEISHEALLTAWPLLRDTWLADTHADRIVRTRLHNGAAEWDRHSRDPSYLHSGSLLRAAAGTAARISADPARHPPLSQTEHDFLHASDHAQRRRARRRQGLIALLAVLVIGCASTTVVAVRAGQQVTRQLHVVTSGLLISQSRPVGDADPDLSKLLAVAAWRINPSGAARSAMLAAAARPGIAILGGYSDAVLSVAFSPDGKTLASGSYDLTARLWNVATPSQNLADVTNLTRYLCALAGRSLTRAEWAQYVPNLAYQRGCHGDSTTHRNRYRPDGPTPRASTMPASRLGRSHPQAGPHARYTAIRHTSSRHDRTFPPDPTRARRFRHRRHGQEEDDPGQSPARGRCEHSQ